MEIFLIMAVSLICTMVIECVGAIVLKVKDKKDIFNVILVNLLTNPLVVSISFFINISYGVKLRMLSMIFLELSAFFIEGYIYDRCLEYKRFNGFVLSFILNVLSYFIGLVINIIIW